MTSENKTRFLLAILTQFIRVPFFLVESFERSEVHIPVKVEGIPTSKTTNLKKFESNHVALANTKGSVSSI